MTTKGIVAKEKTQHAQSIQITQALDQILL